MNCEDLYSCYFLAEKTATGQPLLAGVLVAVFLYAVSKMIRYAWAWYRPAPATRVERELLQMHKDLRVLKTRDPGRQLLFISTMTIMGVMSGMFLLSAITQVPTVSSWFSFPMTAFAGLAVLRFIERFSRRAHLFVHREPLFRPLELLANSKGSLTQDEFNHLVGLQEKFDAEMKPMKVPASFTRS